MNKALLFQFWIFSIGFLAANLYKRSFDPLFRVLIALPIGWALFGIWATVVYSVHFSALSQMFLLGVLAVTTAALLFANIKQGSASKDSILLAMASLMVLTVVFVLVDLLKIVTKSPDSAYIVRFGQNMGLGNYEASRMVFSMWGPLVPLIHSISNLLDQKLFWQYQPILSMNLLALVFYTIYTVIREQKSRLQSVIAATILVSLMAVSNIFVFHFFYIHVNIIAALYMYLFVFALSRTHQQPGTGYERLALVSLISFCLVRLEAPLVAIGILLVATFRPGWSYIDRLKLIIPFTVLSLGWYARVYFVVPDDPDILSKNLIIAFVSVLFGFGLFTVLSGLKVLDPIVKNTPSLTLTGSVLAGFIFTIMKPEHMFSSLESMVGNALVKGNWGLTWYVLLFLLAELHFSKWRSTEHHWMFMVLVTYVVLVFNLAYFGDAYQSGQFDSANRLLLQALPLVVLYLSTGFAGMPLFSIRERGGTSTVEIAR